MKPNISIRLLALVTTVSLALPLSAQTPKDFTKESQAERDARMAWFRQARFGMFIHWGVYSVPAGEWNGAKNYGEWFLEETKMPVSQSEKFAAQFNPVKFDAQAWVRAARDAGMKYIVITSKHHDGFGMYRSELTDWCMKSTPFPRDPLKELAAACKEEGIVFCFYHSIMDWHHPDWGTRRAYNDKAPATPPDMDRYVAYMKGQLKELITGYGPLGILWFDGEWESPWTHQRGVDLYQYVRSLQPDIIVNNRVGKGRSGMAGMDKGQGVGDYGTPEQEIPPTGFGPGVDWESCMTMNNHWGYNQHDQNWKSAEVLIRNLIDCASKGGNYLLNVGPTSEGLIPAPSLERLAKIGDWMSVNGQAIYGTTASPFKRLTWGKCTQKPGRLYLHIYQRPADGRITLPIKNPITKAVLLADRQAVLMVDDKTIRLPDPLPDPIASVVLVEIEGATELDPNADILKQAADGTLTLLAQDAEIMGSARLEAQGGEPNIGYWTDMATTVKWTAHMAQPGAFDVSLAYACPPDSQGSTFEVIVGGKKVSGKIAATKGWADFTTVKLGTIQLGKTGPTEIRVKPTSKPGLGVMNLRSVILTPRGKGQ